MQKKAVKESHDVEEFMTYENKSQTPGFNPEREGTISITSVYSKESGPSRAQDTSYIQVYLPSTYTKTKKKQEENKQILIEETNLVGNEKKLNKLFSFGAFPQPEVQDHKHPPKTANRAANPRQQIRPKKVL
jgi:hypothetical protein